MRSKFPNDSVLHALMDVTQLLRRHVHFEVLKVVSRASRVCYFGP